MDSLRKSVEREIADFYFAHCKRKVRPQFKTLDEASNWHRKNIYIIEKIVGRTTNRILALLPTSKSDHFADASNMINTPALGSKSLPNDYLKEYGKRVHDRTVHIGGKNA
jgi:hypothetical protein